MGCHTYQEGKRCPNRWMVEGCYVTKKCEYCHKDVTLCPRCAQTATKQHAFCDDECCQAYDTWSVLAPEAFPKLNEEQANRFTSLLLGGVETLTKQPKTIKFRKPDET